MSYSGAPSTPNKVWLYVADPYTDGLLYNSTLKRELFCYAKAQGYTGLVMYEMSQFISGGVLGPTAEWSSFIFDANTYYGLEIAAAFGGNNTVNAIINWNNLYPTVKFSAVVSEIEWWNYSHNLPFQDPVTGAYSFFDTVKNLDSIKPNITAAGLDLIGYIGWTYPLPSGENKYESALDVVSIDLVANDIIVRGDFTSGYLTNGRQFTPGQKIIVRDYPSAGVDTEYTLSLVYPIFGNTALRPTVPLPTSVINSDTAVRTHYNILSTSNPFPGILRIIVPGDKTFRFEAEVNPDNAATIVTRGGKVNLSGTPGADGIYDVTAWSYDALNNQTSIDVNIVSPAVIFSNAGYIDPDVFHVTGPMSTFSYTGNAFYDYGRYHGLSELAQLYTLYDEFWLHDYITSPGTPRYSYTRTRSIQLSTWPVQAFSIYGITLPSNKNVSFIVSAESAYSRKFFEGKDSGGTVVYPTKNPIDAYEYIVIPITSSSPSQGGSVLNAQSETDPGINTYLDIEGIVIFKDKDIKGYNTGNGPNIWIDSYQYFTAVSAPPGIIGFSSSYCDDCIKPGGFYTFSQSFLSTPVGSAATLTLATPNSAQCDGNVVSQLNFDLPGTYLIQVGVTDGEAIAYRTVEVFVPSPTLTVNATQTITAICPGTCSNSVRIDISGGTAPYSYQLYDNNGPIGFPGVSGSNSFVLTGVCAGNYSIAVTDFNGLFSSTTYTVSDPLPNFSATFVIQDALCHGGSTGAVFPTLSPGPATAYTYLWSNASTATKLTGVPAGNYSVIITDPKGCSQTFYFTVNEPKLLTASYISSNVLCAGTNSGSIQILPDGGTAPYTYSWSHNPFISTDYFNDLLAGSYTVYISDSNGCLTSVGPITIFDLNPPVSFDISGPSPACNLNQSGETYTAINQVGIAPYTYLWSNGQTGVSANYDWSNDRPGVYTISCTMTDDNGCSVTETFDVEIVTWTYTPTITVSGGPLTSCAGSQVTLQVINPQGTGVWNDPAASTTPTLIIDNLWFYANSPGQPYTFTWTEDDPLTPCVVTGSVTVQPPSLPVLTITAIGPNPCGGPTNVGFIQLTTSGGCPPYTYSWTGPGGFTALTEDISGLVNGSYTCIVTDNGVPAQSESITIEVNTSDPVITGVVTNTGCAGLNTGAINVTTTGGTAPYTYLWDDGATTEDRSNLPVGTYTVTVLDFYGCTDTETFTIVDSNVNGFSVTFQTNPTTINGQDGTITLDIASTSSSGYPSTITVVDQNANNWGTYTVTFDSSVFVSGLPEGTYTITMTNAFGCVTTEVVVLVDPSEQGDQDKLNECIKSIMCCLGKKIASVFKIYNNGHPNIECLVTPLYTANSMLKSVRCWYPENYSFGGQQGYVVATGFGALDNTLQVTVSFLGEVLFTYNPNPGDSTATKMSAISALFQAEGFDTIVYGETIWIYSPENSYYNGLTFNFVTTSFPVAGNPVKGPVVLGYFAGAEDVCYSEDIATSVCLTEEEAGDMFNQLKCFCNG